MRLTLRTLLAYLDDTLDASEIKEIGQKVAESDAAQELVARLKQVTRRRRLTAPSANGPEGTDPNDVAEYLDNELSSDRVSDLEKLALESDVLLAEIAACHQILTLVLGEPALVPPKAKERMYGLVQGREAIPYRKAQQPKKPHKEAVVDEDTLALSSGWLRLVLPAAGLLLIGLLALAVYQVLPGRGPSKDNRVASTGGDSGPIDVGKREIEPKGNGDKDKDKSKQTGDDKDKDKGKGKASGTPIVDKGTEKKPVDANPAVVERTSPPSKDRVPVGTYAGGLTDLPTALVAREDGKDDWKKISHGGVVNTSDTLVAMPGFVSHVRSRTGVGLLLRGLVRDFMLADIMDFLCDSAVILHANPKFDLDVTLLRGRIYLANRKEKGPCKIRLRFENEVWDVTLGNPGDEVAVDLMRDYLPVINYRAGEEPWAQCYLAVLRGEVELKVDAFNSYNLDIEAPKWAHMDWDSFTKTRAPVKEEKLPPSLSKQPPSPEILPEVRRAGLKRMLAALKDLEALLASPKSLDVALRETLEKPDPAARLLAIYCLAAIDAIGPVIDVLGDEDPTHLYDREAAFYSLRRWVGRSASQGKLLYDEKTGTGILIDKKYKKSEAASIFQLLHPVLADDLNKMETYEALARCLQSRKVAIAEMGYWRLLWLCGGKLPAGFNAAMPQEDREKYSTQVQMMIEKKQLGAGAGAAKEGTPEK
jgi:hypothetical protein